MNYIFEPITDNSYALAVYDTSWNSYNNCYIIARNEDLIFIDAGKTEHIDVIVESLSKINKKPENVTYFIATHGHKDHIGGSLIFHNAKKIIHEKDFINLEQEIKSEFFPIEGEKYTLSINDNILNIIHLGHHTPGSIAIYDYKTKALYIGDHICYFGDPLNEEGLVAKGLEFRQMAYDFIKNWIVNPQSVRLDGFDFFIECLSSLLDYDIEFLCTGHGVVLRGDITSFLSELVRLSTYK